MTLILAGASLRFCSTEDAVTTIVSPSSSTANTGHAQEIADKHSPTRTKGFNLNIPYLHEVTTKIKWVSLTSSLRPLAYGSIAVDLFVCR